MIIYCVKIRDNEYSDCYENSITAEGFSSYEEAKKFIQENMEKIKEDWKDTERKKRVIRNCKHGHNHQLFDESGYAINHYLRSETI